MPKPPNPENPMVLPPLFSSEALKHIFKRYHIQTAWLFGSYAKADASKHSDVDLALIQPSTNAFFDRYDGIYLDLFYYFEKAIDLFIYTPEEFEQIKHRPFIQKLIKEGIRIYESNE